MSKSLKGFRHQMVNAGNVRIHAVVGGKGPPLVLIHGFPQTWWEWHRMVPRLAETNTVVAVDLRGAGHSDCPQDGYDKANMAADVHRVMLALGFEHYAVCGHDIGAMGVSLSVLQSEDQEEAQLGLPI
jgi:pimeloyl-ACP methyl ester carboxylesterase